MKHRCHHVHHPKHYRENIDVYIKGKLVLTIRNIKHMAVIQIDIEDNEADLQTAITNFQTAYTALQNSTLSNLGTALADLQTANDALAGFQINFTASVVNTPPAQ